MKVNTKLDMLNALKVASRAYPKLQIGATANTLYTYEKRGVIERPP
ncbi:unnamed protein product, partial [marine sediment metagenome]